MWLAGAGVKRGFQYGATDELGYSIAEDPVSVRDLQATLLHLVGLDPEPHQNRRCHRGSRSG